METLKWQDEYSVGVGDIDNQHRGLMKIINTIIEQQQGNPEAKKFKDIIGSLIHYAYTHFATEENYLTQTNYPDLQVHVLEHIDFIMKVLSLAQLVENGDQKNRDELLSFLKKWYASHVLGIDRLYIPYLAAKGF
jgi:hemerythrin-like metal-binding protein